MGKSGGKKKSEEQAFMENPAETPCALRERERGVKDWKNLHWI